SIAWARVLPAGHGAVNEKGMEFYSKLVDELLANGIEPSVTLYHWDLPQALEDKGGWLNRDTAKYFADYAALMAHRLGDRVKHWGTLNEPEVIVGGYTGGGLAPGLKDPTTRTRVAHNLMLAHGMAVRALREVNAEFEVGITLNLVPVAAATQEAQTAARNHWRKHYALYLDAILKGHYPDLVLNEMAANNVVVEPGDMA